MCDKCVIIESISQSGAIAHIGYGDPDKDSYKKLLEDDIVIQTKKSTKRLSQEDYLELWSSLKNKNGFGVVDSNVPQNQNSACAVCGEYLVTAPAIDAECVVPDCSNTKHGAIHNIMENKEEIRKDMEEYFGPDGAGEGKSNDPIELAIRAGIHCPNNHWVCTDCLTFDRKKILTE
jgi:hypothetical protein